MKKRFSLLFAIVLVWVVSIGCSDSELEENSEKNPVRVSDGNIDIVGTWQLVDYEPNDFEKLPEMILVTKSDLSWSVTAIIHSVAFGKLIVRATGNYEVSGNKVMGETIEASVNTGKIKTEIPMIGTEVFRGESVVKIEDGHLIIIYDDGDIARYKKTG
ncbi:TPA: hypothetical protein EYN98_09340 [Candidatus Poribacteria bacterium]|jgi:hypothetical protein|nr:hypothetical protein [Candidatus Poribacteria bacterium]HIM12237.1 hypothetical protein [Candidatus Poribacteria bacterium]HIN30300.1 hypothetical protein [Candidatus Poribacteria bacterium]